MTRDKLSKEFANMRLRQYSKVVWLVIAIAVGTVLSVLGYILVRPTLSSEYIDYSAVIGSSYLRATFLYFAMVLGIFGNAVHSVSNQPKNRRTPSGLLQNAFLSTGFISAMLVSPIIFF